MFKLKSKLRDPEPGQSGTGAATNNPTAASATAAGAPAAATVDVQAQIDAALAKQQTQFNAQFKEATGHDDIKAFTEAQLKAQGKLQELADASKAEANTIKSKYHNALISNAILSAAAEALDPATVKDLLTGKAQVDDADNVTIDGKPVAEAVKALLVAKPFLAKAQGGTGSGAPAATQSPAAGKPDDSALSPQQRLINARKQG